MVRRHIDIGIRLLSLVVLLLAAELLPPQRVASAQEAEMDAKNEALAKEAMQLYKQGQYEEAAKLFAKLSVEYPDMLVFERNVGACFYYLRKPEPALSNLRLYLSHKKDIEPEDKATVERWIGEMEKLRDQNATAATAVPAAAPATAADFPRAALAPTSAPPAPGVAPTARPSAPSAAMAPAVATASPLAFDQGSVMMSPPPSGLPPAVPAPTPPASLDLSAQPNADVRPSSGPFYAKWWFWGTVGVVVAGAATAYFVATHKGTQNACAGSTIACDAIK